jgi:hypothetical protein
MLCIAMLFVIKVAMLLKEKNTEVLENGTN